MASVDGPWANDTIAYTYDELGRVETRSINGSANQSTVAYDALGRISSTTNPLGTFDYTYVNATGRLSQVEYPNGQVTNYTYFNNAGDQRLHQIENLGASSENLSTFAYTYDADGMIQTWTREIGMDSVKTMTVGYDPIDQLTSAILTSGSTVLKRYLYRYDRAGNRTSEQIDNGVTAATHNAVNEVTGLSPTGPIRFAGTLNEPGTVTVNSQAANVSSSNAFEVDVSLPPGTSEVTVVATDLATNVRTQDYEVTVASGTSRTLTHDANGNMLGDGTGRTYDWDALDRLVTITAGSDVTTFVYDGAGRRVQEKLNGTEVRRWIWDNGLQPSEERNASNAVTKRFFGTGQINGTDVLFYSFDHLGSIRELVDDAGDVRARYDYDPYGRKTKTTGDLEADFGFTGFFVHQMTGLDLTLYRAYDAGLGRWLSRDPISENGGLNLYSYVGNNPANSIDPLGLAAGLAIRAGRWSAGKVLALGAAAYAAYNAKEIANATERALHETQARIEAQKAKPLKNPPTGEPGSEVTVRNPDGTPKQTRRYGPDGYPQTDTDYGHGHEIGQDGKPVGSPHVHDWIPNPSGGFPERCAPRPPRAGDPQAK